MQDSKISNKFVRRIKIFALLSACMMGQSLMAAPATVAISKSTLAIVTQKEGIASGLAHRHIIVAAKWIASLDLKNGVATNHLESGTAKISIPSADLIVDSPDAAQGIVEVLKSGKIWDPSSDKLSPENAEKVRENMLVDSQLAASKFPVIQGSGAFTDCKKSSDLLTECTLELTLKVRDRTVTKTLPLSLKNQDGEWTADFLGKFKFSEFGIKPYTALMGAIAVTDEFVLACRLAAKEG
jgi:hypothetical protein